jgi:DNA-binding transcriptional MerR regulator
MKKEFSQMAFDFPMMAEPPAPPKNGLSAHSGEQGNALVLSKEEEHAVREEGRRAGVVVRIKSLKRSPEQTTDPVTSAGILVQKETPIAPPAMSAPTTSIKSPERVFVQTSIPLEEINLPVVNADIPPTEEKASDRSIPEVTSEQATIEMAAEYAAAEIAPEHASIEDAPEPLVVEETTELTPVEEIPALTIIAGVPDLAPVAAEEVPEPPFPPRKKSTTAPAGKSKPAPAEKAKSKRGRKSLKDVAAEADLIDIPADEVLFSKQYYTMGEVAEMFKVNQSLLRFWETEFSILQPRKNRKGDRYFRPVDIKNLHLIYHLLRQRKYTIEGAKEFLRKNKKAEQRFEAIQRLQQIKSFLLELKAQL